MNTLQIEYFLTLVKYMNFTAAAKSLYVSQPAVSKQIDLFEKEVGVPLFSRTSRSVKLTPSGKIMYEYLTEIMNSYNTAISKARNLYYDQAGGIRLGILDQWDFNELFGNSLSSMSEKFSNVDLYIECQNFKGLIDALNEGRLDMIITILQEVEGKDYLKYKTLKETHGVLIMSQEHPLASLTEPKLSDFKDEEFYVLSPDETFNARFFIMKLCEESGFEPKKVVFVPNYESMRLVLKNRLGVAAIDEYSYLINDPKMKYFRLDYSHKIVAAWKNDNINPMISNVLKTIGND